MGLFSTFFEKWEHNKDLGTDEESKFYAKYDHILKREFTDDGEMRTKFKHLHPDVTVFLMAIKNGDTIPEHFHRLFMSPLGIDRSRQLFTQMIKHGYPDEKFPKDILEYYLKNGSPSSETFMTLKKRFNFTGKNRYDRHLVDRRFVKRK